MLPICQSKKSDRKCWKCGSWNIEHRVVFKKKTTLVVNIIYRTHGSLSLVSVLFFVLSVEFLIILNGFIHAIFLLIPIERLRTIGLPRCLWMWPTFSQWKCKFTNTPILSTQWYLLCVLGAGICFPSLCASFLRLCTKPFKGWYS